MANSNFVVQNGLTVGPLTVAASDGSVNTSGNVSTSGTIRSDKIGISTKTADYTLTGSDSGTTIVVDSASAVSISIPTGLAVGFRCLIVRKGAGSVTINGTTNTCNSRSGAFAIVQQYGSASIFSYASNAYIVDGGI